MADAQNKQYNDWFSCSIDGGPDAQCKVLIDVENAGQMDRTVEVVGKKEGADAANQIRETLNSPRFAQTQRKELEEQQALKKLQLVNNGGELSSEFYSDDAETEDRAKTLETIINADQDRASKYEQYQTLLSSAKNNPAAMEMLRNAVRFLPARVQERFNQEALSRAPHEEIVQYLNTIDAQMQSSADPQAMERLRQEKKQIFQELAPPEKARLFKEAALKSVDEGYDASLIEHRAWLEGAEPQEKDAYHSAFKNVIFETQPQKIAKIYSLMPQEARQTFLKTNQDPKSVGTILQIQEAAASKKDSATVALIKADFEKAGMVSKYQQPGAIVAPAAPTRPAVGEASRPTQSPPRVAQQPTSGAAKEAPAGHTRPAGGGGAVQEALKEARKQSGGAEAGAAISGAAKKVLEAKPEEAARKIESLKTEEFQEVLRENIGHIIKMRESASPDAQARIENEFAKSAPVQKFVGAMGTTGRTNALANMLEKNVDEARALFDGVSGNPMQLKQLRTAIGQLPSDKREIFIKEVVDKASPIAVSRHQKQIEQEISEASRLGKAGDTISLQKEAEIIKNRPAQVQQTVAVGPTEIKTPGSITTAAGGARATEAVREAHEKVVGDKETQQAAAAQQIRETIIEHEREKVAGGVKSKIERGAEIPQAAIPIENVVQPKEGVEQQKLAEDMEKEMLATSDKNRLNALLKEISARIAALQGARASKAAEAQTPEARALVQQLDGQISKLLEIKNKIEAKLHALGA